MQLNSCPVQLKKKKITLKQFHFLLHCFSATINYSAFFFTFFHSHSYLTIKFVPHFYFKTNTQDRPSAQYGILLCSKMTHGFVVLNILQCVMVQLGQTVEQLRLLADIGPSVAKLQQFSWDQTCWLRILSYSRYWTKAVVFLDNLFLLLFLTALKSWWKISVMIITSVFLCTVDNLNWNLSFLAVKHTLLTMSSPCHFCDFISNRWYEFEAMFLCNYIKHNFAHCVLTISRTTKATAKSSRRTKRGRPAPKATRGRQRKLSSSGTSDSDDSDDKRASSRRQTASKVR